MSIHIIIRASARITVPSCPPPGLAEGQGDQESWPWSARQSARASFFPRFQHMLLLLLLLLIIIMIIILTLILPILLIMIHIIMIVWPWSVRQSARAINIYDFICLYLLSLVMISVLSSFLIHTTHYVTNGTCCTRHILYAVLKWMFHRRARYPLS